MGVMDPVANDVRLMRQKYRRQELTKKAIENLKSSSEDAGSNSTEVVLEDDNFLFADFPKSDGL